MLSNCLELYCKNKINKAEIKNFLITAEEKTTYRLNTDLFRLLSKALRIAGSSRVRRSLLALGWNSWRGWEG